jgi:LAO/AO transport system kinase
MPELAERIVAGDARAIARAATLIENRDPSSAGLLEELRRHAGRSLVVGVTGPPGAGKSTLVDQVTAVCRQQGKTVGVIAVDPSSSITGGALLGDRVRMQQHHADPGVFIRSMASRGSLGGLGRATADLVTLLDASGRDVILIETVGVGQAEIDIAGLAQVTVVVLVPGMGDEVQSIKAGILEVADLFVINKADRPGADRLEREIHETSDRPIVKTVASEGQGIEELLTLLFQLPAKQVSSSTTPGIAIDHLGIAVRSIEQALGFYRDQLGLTASQRETVPHEKVHVAMLPVTGSRIELLQASEADSVIARFIGKRGEGLHHVALRVSDFHGTLERLRAAGVRVLGDPHPGAGGHLCVFLHPASTGGVLLELIQEQES